MELYSYWRSSSSWRVRIALRYKRLPFVLNPVHLRDGAQRTLEHRLRNPLGQVPVLILKDQSTLTQSMAILEYLEERHPTPALLPSDPFLRARVRQLAEVINSGIQPLQNFAVLQRVNQLGGDAHTWARAQITEGMEALEWMVRDSPGPYLAGSFVSLADVLLVPQMYNARRFGCALEDWPRLCTAESAALQLPAFYQSHPAHQPDAPGALRAS